MVSDNPKLHFNDSLGVTVMTVESLAKCVEAENLSMDVIFTTPSLVSKLIPFAPVGYQWFAHSQILGPKRLMPSVKQGTVTDQLAEAIQVGVVDSTHGRSSNDRRSPMERTRPIASRRSSDESINPKRRFWRICEPSSYFSYSPSIRRTICTRSALRRFAV